MNVEQDQQAGETLMLTETYAAMFDASAYQAHLSSVTNGRVVEESE